MSRFWEDAVQILETARRSRDGSSGDLALIIDPAGGLRIVPAEGWSTEGLCSEYGGTVYHVTRSGHGVCVEGRAAGMSCTLRVPFLTPPRSPAAPQKLLPETNTDRMDHSDGVSPGVYCAPRESSIALRV